MLYIMSHASIATRRSSYLLVANSQGYIKNVNPAFTDITGYTKDEAYDKSPKLLQSGKHDKEFYHEMWNEINNAGYWEGVIDRKSTRLNSSHVAISYTVFCL